MSFTPDRWIVSASKYRIVFKVGELTAVDTCAFRLDVIAPDQSIEELMQSDDIGVMTLVHKMVGRADHGEVITWCPYLSQSEAEAAARRIEEEFSVPETVKSVERTITAVKMHFERNYKVENDLLTMPTILCLKDEDERLVNELITTFAESRHTVNGDLCMRDVLKHKITEAMRS